MSRFLYRFVVHFGYYYYSVNSGSFGSSMYIAFILGGLVEFPGYSLGFAAFKLGRKPVFIFCMLMSGLSSIGIVVVELYAKGKLDAHCMNTYHTITWDCSS